MSGEGAEMEQREKVQKKRRLYSICGQCGKEAPVRKITLPSGTVIEVYDDEKPCPCGGVYHRMFG